MKITLILRTFQNLFIPQVFVKCLKWVNISLDTDIAENRADNSPWPPQTLASIKERQARNSQERK